MFHKPIRSRHRPPTHCVRGRVGGRAIRATPRLRSFLTHRGTLDAVKDRHRIIRLFASFRITVDFVNSYKKLLRMGLVESEKTHFETRSRRCTKSEKSVNSYGRISSTMTCRQLAVIGRRADRRRGFGDADGVTNRSTSRASGRSDTMSH